MSIQLIIVAGVIIAGLGFGASLMVYQVIRRRTAVAFYFDRQRGVTKLTGDSYSGLVTHKEGGYVERVEAALDMRSGRPFSESGPKAWRRRRSPVFLVRSGDSAPIEIMANGKMRVKNVTDDEYEARVNTASVLAITEASKKNNRGDLMSVTLGAAILLLSVAMAALGGVAVVKAL